MVDHLARAKEMRARARKCQVAADHSKSEKFADCYRLLAENYDVLANVEEGFVAREIVRQSKVGDILQALNADDTRLVRS